MSNELEHKCNLKHLKIFIKQDIQLNNLRACVREETISFIIRFVRVFALISLIRQNSILIININALT